MKITPRPTTFEIAAVRAPSGEEVIVFRMIVDGHPLGRGHEKRFVMEGTPSREEVRVLRLNLGEVLNDAKPRLVGFPTNERDDGPRRRGLTPVTTRRRRRPDQGTA